MSRLSKGFGFASQCSHSPTAWRSLSRVPLIPCTVNLTHPDSYRGPLLTSYAEASAVEEGEGFSIEAMVAFER